MPQLSDEEHRALLADKAIADLVKPLWDDPATSREAKGLLKRHYPKLEIPDHDIREEMNARFAAEEKRRNDEAAAVRSREENAKWKEDRARVQKEYGFTEDEMIKLEKETMIGKNVANYEVAATYHAAKNPRMSDPTASHEGTHWNHGKTDRFKEVSKDPEGYARDQFMAAIARQTAKQRQQQF